MILMKRAGDSCFPLLAACTLALIGEWMRRLDHFQDFHFFFKINFKSFLLIVKMELYLSCENWNDGKNALDVSIFEELSGNVQCTL